MLPQGKVSKKSHFNDARKILLEIRSRKTKELSYFLFPATGLLANHKTARPVIGYSSVRGRSLQLDGLHNCIPSIVISKGRLSFTDRRNSTEPFKTALHLPQQYSWEQSYEKAQ